MKKGKIVTVLNRGAALNILMCTLFLIWYSRVEYSFLHLDCWDLWRLGLKLLDFVLPVLAVSEIFLTVTKMKKLGTVTKKKKIVTLIWQLAELNILMNTVYFVWRNAERREPGLADNMGMGWVLPYLVISEILIICASVYLNKMRKPDSTASAAGEKTLLTM